LENLKEETKDIEVYIKSHNKDENLHKDNKRDNHLNEELIIQNLKVKNICNLYRSIQNKNSEIIPKDNDNLKSNINNNPNIDANYESFNDDSIKFSRKETIDTAEIDQIRLNIEKDNDEQN